MFRSLSRAAAVALLVAGTACSRPSVDTAPHFAVPKPDVPDPALAAKEAEYRENLDEGQKALAAADLDKAVAHFERASVVNPKSAEAPFALARAFVAKKDTAGAIRAYGAGLALNPRVPDAAFERAALLEKAGRLEDASAEYARLIREEIDRKVTAKAYWLRSDLADRLGKRADYRYDREQAMKLDPSYEARVIAGDVIVHNYTEHAITLTLDRVVAPDGTERTPPPGFKFKFPESTSAYLEENGHAITAKSVRITVTVGDRARSFTAAYERGVSLDVRLFPEHLPVR